MGRGKRKQMFKETYYKINDEAVKNWSKYTGTNLELASARKALLKTIEEDGEITLAHPTWMTSPKPDVNKWVHLPENLSLTIKQDKQGNSIITNCLAHKSKRKQTKENKTPGRPTFTKEQIKELETIDRHIFIRKSVHLRERIRERLGVTEEQSYEIIQAVWDEGKLVSPPPYWANSSLRGQVVLKWEGEINGKTEELAVILVPNAIKSEIFKAVGSTALSKTWVEQKFIETDFRVTAKISSKLAGQIVEGDNPQETVLELLQEGVRTLNPKPKVKADGRTFYLMPTKDGWRITSFE